MRCDRPATPNSVAASRVTRSRGRENALEAGGGRPARATSGTGRGDVALRRGRPALRDPRAPIRDRPGARDPRRTRDRTGVFAPDAASRVPVRAWSCRPDARRSGRRLDCRPIAPGCSDGARYVATWRKRYHESWNGLFQFSRSTSGSIVGGVVIGDTSCRLSVMRWRRTGSAQKAAGMGALRSRTSPDDGVANSREGNAGGVVTSCEPPSRLVLTWEFGGCDHTACHRPRVRLRRKAVLAGA